MLECLSWSERDLVRNEVLGLLDSSESPSEALVWRQSAQQTVLGCWRLGAIRWTPFALSLPSLRVCVDAYCQTWAKLFFPLKIGGWAGDERTKGWQAEARAFIVKTRR